jgi:3-oxoacyl-[acyl-carrier-protein] synthase III
MKAKINSISYYLPDDILTNQDLNQLFPEWSVDKIAEKTGIQSRHIANDQTFSSDLAVRAAEKLFLENKIDRSTIDFLILCTQSPDYYLPTTACIVQDRLRLPITCGAFDFNLGCSGYIYGLSIAKGLIETGQANNILLITTETYSKFIHPKDKSIRTIFGDGAACTYIAGVDENQNSIFNFVLGTDGRGASNLIVKAGLREKQNEALNIEFTDAYGNTRNEGSLYMNGQDIFSFTLKSVPKLVEDTLQKNNLSREDIDLFVLHQANRFMLDALRRRMNVSEDKFFMFMKNCGNTVSSTIPIAIYEAMQQGKAKIGSTILLAGFGVGYSWGGTVIKL